MKIVSEICPIAFAHVTEYMQKQQSETTSEAISNLFESSGIIGQGTGETATLYTTVFYPQAAVMYVFQHNADGTIYRVHCDGNVPWGCYLDKKGVPIEGTERAM